MIFVGSNLTMMRFMCTLIIMYLLLLCSMNNSIRIENPIPLARSLSIAALIMNFVWSIPWILLVWDAFDIFGDSMVSTVWKIVGSGMVISAFCTYLASRVVRINHFPTIIKVFKSLPLVCASFLGLDLLLIIWIDDMDVDIVWKLILSELILVLLQWIITQIIMHNADRLNIHIPSETITQSPSQPTPQFTSQHVITCNDDSDSQSHEQAQSDSQSQSEEQPQNQTQAQSETQAEGHPQSQSQSQSQPQVSAQPTYQAQSPKQHSVLSIIGIIALVWIGLSIVVPVITGLIGLILLAR